MDLRPNPRTSGVSRREILLLGGFGMAATALAGCGGRGGPATPAARPALPFTQPKVLDSRDGRLDVTLRAEATSVPFGDGTRYALTYNGTTPGPTLRVRPGDRLTIRLENHLDEPTNLHTHGLHVSPEGSSDNIFVKVEPGGSHTYTYEIPADHRSSLCWYHPHHHGMVAPQLSGGMFGGIIVQDALDQLPAVAGSTERLLVLSDPTVGDGPGVLSAGRMQVVQGREGGEALVNGLFRPRLDATAGRLERWRVLNASPSRYYRLALEDHDLHVIATDDGRLAAPQQVDDLLLAPGERTEVMIVPTTAGAYSLRTLGYDRGSAMGNSMMGNGTSSGEQVLATMQVKGGAAAPAELPTGLARVESLEAPKPVRSRPVTLAMGMGAGSMGGGMGGSGGGMGGGGMMSFTINGTSFDPATTNTFVEAGATEDWAITNTSSMDHPFHLHAWPFKVVGRTAGPADLPGWKDTVNVPGGATVTIRIPFTDITGRTVYHCHILDHEDQGMMGVIQVE